METVARSAGSELSELNKADSLKAFNPELKSDPEDLSNQLKQSDDPAKEGKFNSRLQIQNSVRPRKSLSHQVGEFRVTTEPIRTKVEVIDVCSEIRREKQSDLNVFAN